MRCREAALWLAGRAQLVRVPSSGDRSIAARAATTLRMLERAAALLAIALLTACSAPPGSASESVASSQSPLLTFEFTNLSVTPTDTTMIIAYAEPGALLAVTLGSQTVTASAITNSYTQNQSVTFSGLTPCTSYSWSIPAFSGAVTGQTNTLYT